MTATAQNFGWLGQDAAKREWDRIGWSFPVFKLAGAPPGYSSAGKKALLWEATRIVTGGDIPNIAQAIGDCVSWGCRNAVDYLECVEIALKGDREEYHPSFPPYFYGVSRVLIGGQRGDYSDGSLGSWAADGVRKYGVLRMDSDGCPTYSGQVAKTWGADGPPQKFVDLATPHLIGQTAKLNSYEEVRDAIVNGYPCTVASDIGYEGNNMQGVIDGGKCWEKISGSWGHQMSIVGVDDDPARPGAYIRNSWGDRLWANQPDGSPKGGFWADADSIRRMVDQGETYAFSGFDGFKAREINWNLG